MMVGRERVLWLRIRSSILYYIASHFIATSVRCESQLSVEGRDGRTYGEFWCIREEVRFE